MHRTRPSLDKFQHVELEDDTPDPDQELHRPSRDHGVMVEDERN